MSIEQDSSLRLHSSGSREWIATAIEIPAMWSVTCEKWYSLAKQVYSGSFECQCKS